MSIAGFIDERLDAIRFFYTTAAAPFVENIRRIDAGEEPFDVPPPEFNPEDGEPPFLAEWQRNSDGLTVLGHAGIAMLQVTLQLYLRRYREEIDHIHGKQQWSPRKSFLRGENWFSRERACFQTVLGIDWDEHGPEHIAVLEQIALARDDIFHHSDIWGVQVYQSPQHFERYKESYFADERYLPHFRATGEVFPGRTWAIDVTPQRMNDAVDRVESFCEFMDSKWMSWGR